MTSPSKLGSRFDRAKVRMMPVQVQMIESLARKPAVTMRFSQNSQFLFAENRKKKTDYICLTAKCDGIWSRHFRFAT